MTLRAAPRLALAALAVVALAASCSDDDDPRGEDGRVDEPADISVYELRAGDCLVPPEDIDTGIGAVRVVPCDDPHTQEVFALVPYTDDEGETAGPRADFPGDEPLDEFANAECLTPFADYFNVDYVDSSLFLTFLAPTVRSWDERDDREIVCIAQTDGEPVTESLARDGR